MSLCRCAAKFLLLLALHLRGVLVQPSIVFSPGSARPILLLPWFEWLVYLSTMLLSLTAALSLAPFPR